MRRRSATSFLLTLVLGCAGMSPHPEPRLLQPSRDGSSVEIVALIGSGNPLYEVALGAFREQVKAPLSVFTVRDDAEVLMRTVRARRPGLILAIGPRAALTARRYTPDIPMLFTMVVNHQQHLELVDQSNVMGIALEPPPAMEFLQFKLLLPDMKRVLTFYSPRESESLIEDARAQLAPLGLVLDAVPVRSPGELREQLEERAGDVDAVWLINDRMMANEATFDWLKVRSIEKKLPLLTSLSHDYAKGGALMSVAVDFRSVGSQAAAVAGLFLEGHKSAREIGIEPPAGTALSLNRTTAAALGIEVPDETVQFIDRFFPADPTSARVEPPRRVLAEPLPSPLFDLFVEVAAKRAQPASEAPAIVSVYTAQQIRELGFRTLGELLDYVTAVQRILQPNAESFLVVRGFATENGVAVLIDGVPVLDPITGQFAHYDMPLTGLKRVEVQRGPGSALYGGNAQAAVINLVTTDATDASGSLSARLLTGGDASFSSSEGAYGQLLVAIAANRFETPEQTFESDGTKVRGDLQVGAGPQSLVDPALPDRIESRNEPLTSGVAHLRYLSPWGLILRGTAAIRDVSPLVNPGPGGTSGRNAVTPEGDFERRDTLAFVDLRYQTDLDANVDLFASATYVLNHRDQGGRLTGPLRLSQDRDQSGAGDEWPEGMMEDYRYAAHTAVFEVRADSELPHDNLLTAGLALSFSKLTDLRYRANFENSATGASIGIAPTADGQIHDLTGELFVLPGTSRLSFGLFAQDIFEATSWLTFVGGARLDVVHDRGILSDVLIQQDERCAADRFGLCEPLYGGIADGKTAVQVSPRIAAILRLPYALRLKLLWGSAFTPPPLGALSNQTFSENSSTRASNPLLRSLTSQTLEVLLQMNASRLLSWELAGFWIRTQNEVVFDPSTATFQNVAHRQIVGGEAGFSGELTLGGPDSALLYGAGLSLQSTFALEDQVVGPGADIYPNVLVRGRLGVRLFEWLTATALVRWTSESEREPGDDRPPLPSYTLADLRVSAHDPNTGLSFGFFAKNLFDVRYADPTLRASGLDDGFPRGGRTLEAVIEYAF